MRFYLHIEEVLIVVLLTGLATMAYFVDTPVLEAISYSRLTYVTALLLPFVTAIAWFLGQQERASFVLRDWWQVVGTLAVYENLKHLHANRITEWLGIMPMDSLMIDADRWLFGMVLPIAMEHLATDWLVRIMWIFYIWGYYLGPLVFLAWAYFARKDDSLFLRLRKGLVLGLLGGYVIYLLVPVAGPMFTVGRDFSSTIATQPFLENKTFDGLRYSWDCFPSLHTAIPWALTFIAWRNLGVFSRLGAIAWASGITLSTLILRYHYGIDLIAGLAWALIVTRSVRSGARLIEPFHIPLYALNAIGSIDQRHQLEILFVLSWISGMLAVRAMENILFALPGLSVPGTDILLVVYLLGLPIGAGGYAGFARKTRRPIAMFAVLAGGVCLWALSVYLGFLEILRFLRPVLQLGSGGPLIQSVLQGLLVAAWMLPPALCMGASLPATVDAISRMGSNHPARSVSRIYALNLLGALLGAVLGPTVALPRGGVDWTILFAALLDGIVCLYAIRLANGFKDTAQGHIGS